MLPCFLMAMIPFQTVAYPPDRCPGELNAWVLEITNRLTHDSIWYSSATGSDCSGMMHRVFDSLAIRCHDLDLPDRRYRDSRAIAAYFTGNKHLHRVANPGREVRHVQPGMVLFFSNVPVDKMSKKEIPEGICHVGIVTRVIYDEQDRIQSLELFHGRRPGTVAGKSILKADPRTGREFRNGNQYWVAYATID
ncbi:MAG: hypothetical protein R2806_12930 [Saprospiraceae bacterium]